MCDYILVFSLVLNNLVILFQRIVFIQSILCMWCESVVYNPCPRVYFHRVDTLSADTPHGQMRVLEILADIFTIGGVRNERCRAVCLAVQPTVDVPRFVVELGRVAESMAYPQSCVVFGRDCIFQSLDGILVFVDACGNHENFLFYFSSIFECDNV